MTDTIVYMVHELPGGQDGMDRYAKGGPVQAFLDKKDAEAYVGRDTRYKIVPTVVDLLEEFQQFHGKCNPLHKLLMSTVVVKRRKGSKSIWDYSLCLK